MKRSQIKKKSASSPEWRKARGEVIKRADRGCEARTVWCTGAVQHVHHILRRSQGGGNEITNLLGLCFRCHEWIHANPKKAAQAGLLKLRKETTPGG